MAIVEEIGNNKHWRRYGETGTHIHCWWNCNNVKPLWKTVWHFLKMLNIDLPHDPEILLLGIYPREMKISLHKGLYTNVHSSIAKTK